jgi:hypothetical protein
MPGVNFACIGDVAHYHTPLDNFENASPATLQHHGENALAMVRALAQTDLDAPRKGTGNAVFFDLFGVAVGSWPQEATPLLAAVTLLLVLIFIRGRLRREGRGVASAIWGVAGSLSMLFAPVAACLAAIALLKAMGALPTQWVAHPQWLMATLWLLSILFAWILAGPFARRAGMGGLWAGIWILWASAALALAVAAPGLSFVFLVPALAAALLGWSDARWAAGVPAALASLFWLPMAWFLYDGLGVKGGAVIAAMVALPAGTLALSFSQLAAPSRRLVILALATAALVSFAGASLAPASSADSPERLPIVWHEDGDTRKSRWLASPDSGKLPPTLRDAGHFTTPPIAPFPWSRERKAFAADAAEPNLPAPEWVTLQDTSEQGRRRVRARVRSPRGAPIIFFAFSPASRPTSIAISGKPVPELDPRTADQMGGWRVYSCLTVPPEGIDVEICPSHSPIDLFIGDRTAGLPPGGERLAAARPRTAVTSQGGDASIVTRRLRLE